MPEFKASKPTLPARVILSRKGFDSGSGGTASPILPDGRPLSLPIPDGRAHHRYGDLAAGQVSVGDLVQQLTKGRMRAGHRAHLDPDIDASAVDRPHGFKAAFGQTGAAQSHLASSGVGIGDLFLFFGWFREIEVTADGVHAWRRGAPDLHAMFGWMRVGGILQIPGREAEIVAQHPEIARHPHLNRGADPNNTIYLATDRLGIPGLPDLPGAGVFDHITQARTLTAPGGNRSRWKLPSWMHPDTGKGVKLTYHEDRERWSDGYLRSAARGQEFVLSGAPQSSLKAWLARVFSPKTI